MAKWFEKIVQSMLSLVRIALLSKRNSKKGVLKKTAKDLVILGNGPSLTSFLEEKMDFIKEKELLCVNRFPESKYYTIFRPKYLVINAPEIWRTGVDAQWTELGDSLFQTIAEKTNWPLTFFIGSDAKKYKRWKTHFAHNENVHIVYFNATPVEGFSWFKDWFFGRGSGMPRPHNIVIPALILGVNLAFENIYISGADHNVFKEIVVDDENRVYLTQKHFYDAQEAKAAPMNKAGIGERKIHEVLEKFYLSFKGYHEIMRYAKNKGVRIINITSGSFIDAFPKEKI